MHFIYGVSTKKCQRVPSYADDFKPKRRDKYMLMYEWMDYVAQTEGVNIQHKLNTGKEKRIGPYPVDRFDSNTNTVYQFHGKISKLLENPR